eukprot:scaffold44713_cov90-Phaeocystis_antarctica.AAC.1
MITYHALHDLRRYTVPVPRCLSKESYLVNHLCELASGTLAKTTLASGTLAKTTLGLYLSRHSD